MSVAILLSTYNGESYISAQLYSILGQMAPNDILIIRDDGSTDNTVQAIVEFSDPRIQLMHGINIGFVASFFELLRTVSWEHDVFMLADQDDVWLPDKISRASIALTSQDGSPHLYCSRLRLVDSQLNTLGLSPDYLKSLT
ncbi:MAG: glycosyltransferase, partial [Alcaligenaceae bacterium]